MKLLTRFCTMCKQKLCTGDYGWYCNNDECDLFDMDIHAIGLEGYDETI